MRKTYIQDSRIITLNSKYSVAGFTLRDEVVMETFPLQMMKHESIRDALKTVPTTFLGFTQVEVKLRSGGYITLYVNASPESVYLKIGEDKVVEI
jgi:hypothetical protein